MVLIVCLVLAGVSAYYVASTQSEQYTEFYLLTETESGTLVAADYPHEFIRNESRPVVIGITNRRSQQMEYTLGVEQQRTERDDTGQVRVVDAVTLDQRTVTVGPNETRFIHFPLRPSLAGTDFRIQFQLSPTGAGRAPPQTLHLWANVTANESVN